MNRPAEAKQAYSRALELSTNAVEQEFLKRRISVLQSTSYTPATENNL